MSDARMQELLNEFITASDYKEKQKLATKMNNIDKGQAYHLLLELLDDPTYRMLAFYGLRQLSRPPEEIAASAYDKLMTLVDDNDVEIQRWVVSLLPRLHHREKDVFATLLQLIQQDSDTRSRNTAIVGIGSVGGIPRVDKLPLVEILTQLLANEAFQANANSTLNRMGFATEYKDSQCSVCGRGQKEVQLWKCLECGKVICLDHSYRRSNYCSEEHYREYQTKQSGTTNPQYW